MIGLVKLNDRIGDFGAQQVILVRDGTSKNRLQKQIGEMALVLTILESKGMEFDDVLAYDFFSASDIGSSYRCLCLLSEGARKQFDPQKHAVSPAIPNLDFYATNIFSAGFMFRAEGI